MYKVTIEQLANAKFQEPRDLWTIWAGEGNGVHVASMHPSMKTQERREMSKKVTDLMNGTIQPVEGEVWAWVSNHALSLNGVKKIVVSTHLPLDVRDWLVKEMLRRMNASVKQLCGQIPPAL
jgi:hypothetical protein